MRKGLGQRLRGRMNCVGAAVLVCAILLFGGLIPVERVRAAGGQERNVYDGAAIFTESEAGALEERIAAFEEVSGWNVYAVTTSDAMGKTARDYADDFFDEHSPEQEDGVALLIDMDNREITISTSGIAIRYLTDARIDSILDAAYVDVANGNYGACMMTLLSGVEQYYEVGILGGQYNYDTQTGRRSVYRSIEPFEMWIAAGISIACGVIFYLFVVGKYRLRFGAYQCEYRENSRVDLRVKEDRFVNQTLAQRRIPKQTGNGGGSGRSSTHSSSSGHSHGGGSRKF